MADPARRFRYRAWDGSQADRFPSADELMEQIAEDLMQHGDLRTALRNLMQRGFEGGEAPMQGLRDLIRQLRQQRRERLERYDLSSVMDGIREQLDEILALERATLKAMREGRDGPSAAGPRPVDPFVGPLEPWPPVAESDGDAGAEGDARAAGDGGADGEPDFAGSLMGDIAGRSEAFLDDLPQDAPGQVRALQAYEFTEPLAQKKFEELLDSLRGAMTKTFFNDVEKMIRDMSAGDIQRMKDMVSDLNDALVQQIAGEEPDFDGFMDKYGDMFGDDPPKSFDDLVQQMQARMAAMQSLMMSMPTSQFEQLQQLLSDRFGDPELDAQLRKLMQKLDFLDPPGAQRYRFDGDEALDLQAAMDLMGEMQSLEALEGQLREAQMEGDLSGVDVDKVQELLGDDAADALEQMEKLLEVLEEAGFVRRDGDHWELSPRGMRMIGQKALGEIYRSLRKQNLGNHRVPEEGSFGERVEETKTHEYGEAFNLHMARTLQNALRRGGPGTPVQLASEDFEVYRNELITKTATVMLVDLSWSMELRGAFPSAKKVALALNNLITSAYPRDSFYLVGFSAYAKELKPHEIPFLTVDEYVLGTNIQHALMIAEKLLARHQGGSRQILMITDGEPTAHIENGRAQFAYPPTPMTIRETIKAVKRCTAKGITINTFMLDESYYLRAFMDQVSKINGGRVFYSSPEKLGEYILVDYVSHKKKVLGKR
ncbi:MAG TPA: VWA domain-containing protein [Pseudomonadales bacterium]|nr:VWA domain-containing protein [Pseudomonadales bacterium]